MNANKTKQTKIQYQGAPLCRSASQYELSFIEFDVQQIVIFSKPKSINIKKYISAIRISLESFKFIFFRFNAQQLILDDKSQLVFEYMKTNIPLSSQLNNLIPDKNENGMLSIKLTEGKDHFAIGYFFNHTLLDQSSILQFLSQVSKVYNSQIKTKVDDVVVLNSEKQPISDDKLMPATISDHASIASRFAKIHKSLHPMKSYPMLTDDQRKYKVSLNIPKSSLKALQAKWSKCNLNISSNDIINAILITLAAHDEELMKYGPLECQFPMNVRGKLGLSSSYIGNYLLLVCYDENDLHKHAQAFDIKALAQVIKQKVKSVNPYEFNNLIHWYATLNDRGESHQDYIPRFQHNPAMVQTTNWASFDYHAISLDQAKFVEVTQPVPCYFRPYLCPIIMSVRDDEIIYTCRFSTLSDMSHTLEKINSDVFGGAIDIHTDSITL